MTAHLDMGATDHTTGRDPGEAVAGPQSEPEANPLRQQARDRELAQRLDRRLPRCELPDIELLRLQGMRVPIQRYLAGKVVIEFLPGGSTASSQEGDRVTLHRAHMNRWRALETMGTKPIFVTSALPEALDPANGYFDPGSLMLCDPELLIADALGLPTVQEGDARHYRRLSLITRCGRIEKVIFPPEQDIEKHTRRVISWMQTARW
jgi:hypothetical protein